MLLSLFPLLLLLLLAMLSVLPNEMLERLNECGMRCRVVETRLTGIKRVWVGLQRGLGCKRVTGRRGERD